MFLRHWQIHIIRSDVDVQRWHSRTSWVLWFFWCDNLARPASVDSSHSDYNMTRGTPLTSPDILRFWRRRTSEDWMMNERMMLMNWWHVLLMPGLKYKNNCANFLISHCLQLIKTFGGIFRSFTLIARVAKCSQGGEMNSRWLERSLRRVSPALAIPGLWLAPESRS